MVIDSGASLHMFFDRSLFFDFSVETQRKVKMRMGLFRKLRVLEMIFFSIFGQKWDRTLCDLFRLSFSS